MARREQALKIEIPSSEADRLKLGRVGLVALGGFVLGIAWPRLAGITLVPSPPVEDQAPTAPESSAEAAAAVPGSVAPAVGAAASPAFKAAPSEALAITVGAVSITSCRDQQGRRQTECGALALDALVRPPLQALAGCRAAGGARGTLSLGFEVDFEAGKLTDLKSGKSTTLGKQTSGALVDCVRPRLESLTLDGVQHEHPRYTVYYSIEVTPNEVGDVGAPAAGSGAPDEIVAASGRATVSWNVALVRAEPKDGEVVARVLNGTRVVVTGRRGDWYRIKYDAKGNEGWVYRTAIGL